MLAWTPDLNAERVHGTKDNSGRLATEPLHSMVVHRGFFFGGTVGRSTVGRRVRVGLLFSLSGSYALLGQAMYAGALLASARSTTACRMSPSNP